MIHLKRLFVGLGSILLFVLFIGSIIAILALLAIYPTYFGIPLAVLMVLSLGYIIGNILTGLAVLGIIALILIVLIVLVNFLGNWFFVIALGFVVLSIANILGDEINNE